MASTKVTVAPTPLQISLQALFSLDTDPPGTRRWEPHPVINAQVDVTGTAISVRTNRMGNAILPRAGLPANPITLHVAPDATQLSPGPAGPATAAGMASPPTMMFRPFDVTVSVDPTTGFLAAPTPAVVFTRVPSGPPAHARVFTVTPTVFTIDWKPDWIHSANHDPAPTPRTIDCLVLHQTALIERMGNHINTFTNPSSHGSAHYLVDVDGHVLKLVQETFPSWHAGWSFWGGALGVNRFSIGIEIVHADTPTPHNFTNEQYAALLRLVAEIRTSFPAITRQRVVAHGDVEIAGRRRGQTVTHFQVGTDRLGDPGPMFEWQRFEAAGLARRAAFVGPPNPTIYGITAGQTLTRATRSTPAVQANVLQIKRDLSAIGYSVSDTDGMPDDGTFGEPLFRALQRFQQRYFSAGRMPAGAQLGVVDYQTARTLQSVLSDTGP